MDVPEQKGLCPGAEERPGGELVIEPRHRMFRTPQCDVHVHLWPSGGEEERDQLLFRDWLRTHDDDRALYESVKRDLASREWSSMQDYADAKTDVVSEIIGRARAASPA